MSKYQDCYCQMDDGINVFYRDYGDPGTGKTPVLCIPGLSRSSLGFHNLATALSSERRVLCVDLRGRGKSDYDPNYKNYHPEQYISDVKALLRDAGVDRVVIVGTSLGGVIAMTGGKAFGDLLAGVAMNDIGPYIEREGLYRIQSYVGKTAPPKTWDDALAQVNETSGIVYPNYSDAEMMTYTRTIYAEDADGNPVDYFDPNIAKNFVGPVDGDMWPLFEQLYHVPVSIILGEISDILSQETAEAMAERHPDAALFTVPNVGHTPSLDEPESRAGIQRLLEKVDS